MQAQGNQGISVKAFSDRIRVFMHWVRSFWQIAYRMRSNRDENIDNEPNMSQIIIAADTPEDQGPGRLGSYQFNSKHKLPNKAQRPSFVGLFDSKFHYQWRDRITEKHPPPATIYRRVPQWAPYLARRY